MGFFYVDPDDYETRFCRFLKERFGAVPWRHLDYKSTRCYAVGANRKTDSPICSVKMQWEGLRAVGSYRFTDSKEWINWDTMVREYPGAPIVMIPARPKLLKRR